jgi:hypothetical protein
VYAAARMYGPQRRFFCGMTALAAACCLAPSALGATDLALALVPVLVILGLLLCGRYAGEERILAIRRAGRPLTAPRAPRRLPRPAPARPLASLLTRRPALERGPPWSVAPLA